MTPETHARRAAEAIDPATIAELERLLAIADESPPNRNLTIKTKTVRALLALAQHVTGLEAERTSIVEFLKHHTLNPADYHVDFARGVQIIIASLMVARDEAKAKICYLERRLAEREGSKSLTKEGE